MNKDSEIGRVVAVDTAEITVQLSRDMKGLTRSTYEGAHEVGRINSYVIVPVGAARLVGIVTKVVMVEEAEVTSARTVISLPTVKRILKATLIGTIEGGEFTHGVTQFPILDSSVHLPTRDDLTSIFDESDHGEGGQEYLEGYCIPIGRSPLFPEFEINVDPDKAFGKHMAVIGSTGSGKSSTIAALMQILLSRGSVRYPNIVILDTNGEYRAAFEEFGITGQGHTEENSRCLYIPSSPDQHASRIVIPYWFMNVHDFVRLFRASPGVQKPVLLEALRSARGEAEPTSAVVFLYQQLMAEIYHILNVASQEEKTSKSVMRLARGLGSWVKSEAESEQWTRLQEIIPGISSEEVEKAANDVAKIAEGFVDAGKFTDYLPAKQKQEIRKLLEPIYETLLDHFQDTPKTVLASSPDAPSFFQITHLRNIHIPEVLRRDEAGGRAREHAGSMLLRIDRLLQDPRFEFMFGERGGGFPSAKHSLALFLRDVLGLASTDLAGNELSSEEEVKPGELPFYDRQRGGSQGHGIVVVDLSLLASDVLDNVTALIGRLILELLQRIGQSEKDRGKLPVVLVLEEAQNYIQEMGPGADEGSVSKEVYERIAREGRKYGLGLVVASQRPSELSKTVLAQCSSFVVHKLQNPEDLRYFKQIVPSIFESLLDQLPALAPQTALLLGEFVRAPVLARIRDANPLPESRDPEFMKQWQSTSPPAVPVEEIAARWEAGDLGVDQSDGSVEE